MQQQVAIKDFRCKKWAKETAEHPTLKEHWELQLQRKQGSSNKWGLTQARFAPAEAPAGTLTGQAPTGQNQNQNQNDDKVVAQQHPCPRTKGFQETKPSVMELRRANLFLCRFMMR